MLDESELETIPARSIGLSAPLVLEAGSAPNVDFAATTAEPSIDQLSKKMLSRTDAPTVEPAEPDHETAAEIAASDERVRLQARLLEELQTLRDLGISYSESQAQMKRVVGKAKRDELTNDETEKVIASFCDWSKELAETLRSKK